MGAFPTVRACVTVHARKYVLCLLQLPPARSCPGIFPRFRSSAIRKACCCLVKVVQARMMVSMHQAATKKLKSLDENLGNEKQWTWSGTLRHHQPSPSRADWQVPGVELRSSPAAIGRKPVGCQKKSSMSRRARVVNSTHMAPRLSSYRIGSLRSLLCFRLAQELGM